MAPPRYSDCFDYLIRMSIVCGHPPFSPPTKFSTYLSHSHLVVSVVLFIRMCGTVILGYRGIFIALGIMICLVDCFIIITQIKTRFQDYQMLFREMDEFLSENEYSAITGEKNYFLRIWKKERPAKLLVSHLIVTIIVTIIWTYNTIYEAAVNPEVLRAFYWSPCFGLKKGVKWMYVGLEMIVAFPLTLFPWYFNSVFMSIIKFQHARFIYLKELAIHISKVEFEKEKIVYWLRSHQQTLRSSYIINDLLGLHALCSYFMIITTAVCAIIIFLFENVTQDRGQKVMALILALALVGQFGYNCIIFDKWEEEEKQIKEIFFNDGLFKGDKWQVSTYSICMARLNKPVKFTGLNFVNINSVTCRIVVTNIYSLYTSLRIILRYRTL